MQLRALAVLLPVLLVGGLAAWFASRTPAPTRAPIVQPEVSGSPQADSAVHDRLTEIEAQLTRLEQAIRSLASREPVSPAEPGRLAQLLEQLQSAMNEPRASPPVTKPMGPVEERPNGGPNPILRSGVAGWTEVDFYTEQVEPALRARFLLVPLDELLETLGPPENVSWSESGINIKYLADKTVSERAEVRFLLVDGFVVHVAVETTM